MKDNKDPFDHLHLGICRKRNDQITYQNDDSKSLCGDKQNEFCRECSDHIYQDTQKQGFSPRYRITDDEVRMIVRHHESNEEVVFLIAVDSDIAATILSFLKTSTLTEQERVVLKHICEGYTNDEIQHLLCISKATLKTHINHLHQKIPDLITFRKTHLS